MNSKQTYERLLPIIAQIDLGVICQAVVDNSDGTYAFNCNYTKWALQGYTISILGVEYTITDVVYNVSITVSGPSLPAVLTFDLYGPIFKHGTIKVVAGELNKVLAQQDRLPLLWLKEVVIERLHFDPVDAIETENEVQLFAVCNANHKDWDQLQGDVLAIRPMRSLLNEVIKVLADNQYTAPLTSTGEVKNYNRFGNYEDKGVLYNYFNEPLAGCGLRITIPFLKDCDCCTGSALDNRLAPGYVLDGPLPGGNILAVLYSNEYYIATGGICVGVTITDQFNNILSTIASGGNYDVTKLTTIKDTITANEATIIDNINN